MHSLHAGLASEVREVLMAAHLLLWWQYAWSKLISCPVLCPVLAAGLGFRPGGVAVISGFRTPSSLVTLPCMSTHQLGEAGPARATATCCSDNNICCWYDMLCGLHRSHVVGLETRNCCVLCFVLWQTHHTVVALLIGGGVSNAA